MIMDKLLPNLIYLSIFSGGIILILILNKQTIFRYDDVIMTRTLTTKHQ